MTFRTRLTQLDRLSQVCFICGERYALAIIFIFLEEGGGQEKMPNIKSASKRALLSQKAAAKNKAAKSLMKTNIKKFDAATTGDDHEAAEQAYKVAVKTVDRAATKGLIHKNKAARKKSALTKKLNSM